MKHLLFALSLCGLLAGCDADNQPSPQAIALIDAKAKLATAGTDLGTLPDGRHVTRYTVPDENNWGRHTLYVVEATASVSQNHFVSKRPVQVEVTINGTVYVPKAQPSP